MEHFEVSALSLAGKVHTIFGNGAPGSTPETEAAPLSSSYHDIDSGSQWQKIAMAGGPGDWVELAGKEAALIVQHVASLGVIIDRVPVRIADQFTWAVTAVNEAAPANKWSALVNASHDGTATQDATGAKYGLSNILMQGSKIPGLSVSVSVSGTGEDQFMNLHVAAQSMSTFTAYRMIKNLAGSRSVVFSESVLAAHATDGTAHLTPAQNTLLDGLDPQLSSANLNSLKGFTGNLAQVVANLFPGTWSALGGKPVLPYDLVATTFGVAANNEQLLRVRACRAFTIPKAQTGAQAVCGVAPAAATTFTIMRNAGAIGTVTFAAGSTTGTVSITTAGDVSVAPGDLLVVKAAATADTVQADVDITILGNM